MSSEALAKEDWSFGGLRRTIGATGSCPWGFTFWGQLSGVGMAVFTETLSRSDISNENLEEERN